MNDMQIREMVNRFLSWRLPDDFDPDGGIYFSPVPYRSAWPRGTNLLNATQAEALVRHLVGAPANPRVQDTMADSDGDDGA